MYWVPNPVRHFEASDADIRPDPAVITFVNVGRYAFQKGQDLLVRAFARLYERRRNVRLNLVGHGSDKAALADQIQALGLSEVVRLVTTRTTRNGRSSRVMSSSRRLDGRAGRWRSAKPSVRTARHIHRLRIRPQRHPGRPTSRAPDPPDDEEALIESMEYYCDNIILERSFSEFRKLHIDQYSAERIVHIHADAIRQSAC